MDTRDVGAGKYNEAGLLMAEYIVTWDTYFKDRPEVRAKRMRVEAQKRGVDLWAEPEIDKEITTTPIVVQGVWQVLCPFCSGAELAREDELFMCQSCYNADIGRKLIRAPFPEKRRGIERELAKRRNPQTRNWVHGETITALTRENKEHGVVK